MQITGQSLSVVRTELENLEQEARQKVKNSGAALRNVRRAFGETVGGDGVEVFRRLQSKVIEHVFRVSAGFCFILRRVSSILRHPAWEFTDYLSLSFRRTALAC
jgi:hypothetical protein